MNRALGEVYSWLNVRTLCVFATLVLLACPLSDTWLFEPNAFLYNLGVHLTPKPEPPSQLVKVLVPREEMDRLVKDMPGAVGAGNFLQGLQGVFTRGVLLVANEWPNTESYASEVLVPRMLAEGAVRDNLQSSGLLAEIEAIRQRHDHFVTQLQDGSLLLGILQEPSPAGRGNGFASVAIPGQEPETTFLSAAGDYFHPDPAVLAPGDAAPVSPGYPVYAQHHAGIAYPLLWRIGNAQVPDGLLKLLQKTLGSQPLVLREHNVLLNKRKWMVSAGHVIYPMYSSTAGLSDSIATVALADVRNASDFTRFYNKTVIIGAAGDPAVADIAAAYYSLEQQAYYTEPPWYPWLEKGALPLLLLYLFLLVPRLGVKAGLALTATLSMALLMLQLALQFSQMLWLPTGLLLLYLIGGHGCALLWIHQRKYLSPGGEVNAETGSGTIPTKLPPTVQRREEPRMPDTGFARTVADKPRKFSLGRYEIDSELGRGAMGVVYLGHDPSIDRKVAIKTLNYAQFPRENLAEVKERFFREAKAAGNLKHQNIVTIYEMAETEDRAYIAMEYVGGKPLSAYTKKGQLLPVDEVYWIIIHVAEALGYAHEHNIVHRDIKPSNILYDREREEVKVADFGIARITDHASTRTGDVLGSPLYMSPEQIKGERVSGASDIFSLGVTFYQLLTGELPFTGDTMAAITHQIVNGKYSGVNEINPGLPESAQRIIAKALQKNPEKRFGSAYEMSDLLQKYLNKG
jgi:tRNA A-37 threonylcarbamoyl transferase component Bud32